MNRKRIKNMTIAEFLEYSKSLDREQRQIEELQKRRPLVQGDRLNRSTVLVDGMAFWQSSIIRKDNSIEVWVKRVVDFDDEIYKATHHGWTLVAGFEVNSEPTETFISEGKGVSL